MTQSDSVERRTGVVNTLPATQAPATNAWVQASWREFLALTERPDLKNACFYYDSGWMRIETMLIGSAHGRDNSVLFAVMSLYGTLKDINYVASFVSASFRKAGERECQPDLAYYIDSGTALEMQVPPKNNQPVKQSACQCRCLWHFYFGHRNIVNDLK